MDELRARPETIEDFAAALRELRKSVGNPAFREMSGRSGAISHTTLYEATKGNRLPSWETTVEFVKACGADPAAYRERWEMANLALRSTGIVPVSAGPPKPRPTEEIAVYVPPALPVRVGLKRFLPALPAAAVLTTTAVALGVTVLVVAVVDRGPGSRPKAAGPAEAASTDPRIPGDISQFVGDVTIPDGTVVRPGERFVKTWEIRNAGTATWRGRFLARGSFPADNGSCETPAKVPVPDTRPGKKVLVSVPATAPREPGSCWVGWKMVDGEGKPFLPGARPIYFVVNVRR